MAGTFYCILPQFPAEVSAWIFILRRACEMVLHKYISAGLFWHYITLTLLLCWLRFPLHWATCLLTFATGPLSLNSYDNSRLNSLITAASCPRISPLKPSGLLYSFFCLTTTALEDFSPHVNLFLLYRDTTMSLPPAAASLCGHPCILIDIISPLAPVLSTHWSLAPTGNAGTGNLWM